MAMFYNTNRRPQETIVYTLQPPRPWNLTQRAVQFWADNALQSTRRPRPQLSCQPITTDYAHCQYRLTCLRLELTIQGLQWLRDQRTFMSAFFTWLITSQFSRVNSPYCIRAKNINAWVRAENISEGAKPVTPKIELFTTPKAFFKW